jgi:hypothetical protein
MSARPERTIAVAPHHGDRILCEAGYVILPLAIEIHRNLVITYTG